MKNLEKVDLLELSVELGFSKSKGEARRILKQRGMKIDGRAVDQEKYDFEKNSQFVFSLGKLKMIKLLT